jgi:hypothetical protein
MRDGGYKWKVMSLTSFCQHNFSYVIYFRIILTENYSILNGKQLSIIVYITTREEAIYQMSDSPSLYFGLLCVQMMSPPKFQDVFCSWKFMQSSV